MNTSQPPCGCKGSNSQKGSWTAARCQCLMLWAAGWQGPNWCAASLAQWRQAVSQSPPLMKGTEAIRNTGREWQRVTEKQAGREEGGGKDFNTLPQMLTMHNSSHRRYIIIILLFLQTLTHTHLCIVWSISRAGFVRLSRPAGWLKPWRWEWPPAIQWQCEDYRLAASQTRSRWQTRFRL